MILSSAENRAEVRARVRVRVEVRVRVRVKVRVRVGRVYMTVSNHLYVCAYTFFVAAQSTSPPVTTITAKTQLSLQLPSAGGPTVTTDSHWSYVLSDG